MYNPDPSRYKLSPDGTRLIDTQPHEKVLRAQLAWDKSQAAQKRRSHHKPEEKST